MDDDEFFVCVDCRRELGPDEAVRLVLHDQGIVPICRRCEHARRERARAPEAHW